MFDVGLSGRLALLQSEEGGVKLRFHRTPKIFVFAEPAIG
jgi:hypothetical protein